MKCSRSVTQNVDALFFVIHYKERNKHYCFYQSSSLLILVSLCEKNALLKPYDITEAMNCLRAILEEKFVFLQEATLRLILY